MPQFDTIKKLADEGSCVFIGRCADYALEDYPNVVSVFITGDEEDKIKRISELYDVDEAKAKDLNGQKPTREEPATIIITPTRNGAIQKL